jgi:hypothetical protein
MSDTTGEIPKHEQLIKGFAAVNWENELGQLRDKAIAIAKIEGKEGIEAVQDNLDELVEASKKKMEEDKNKPLEYP